MKPKRTPRRWFRAVLVALIAQCLVLLAVVTQPGPVVPVLTVTLEPTHSPCQEAAETLTRKRVLPLVRNAAVETMQACMVTGTKDE